MQASLHTRLVGILCVFSGALLPTGCREGADRSGSEPTPPKEKTHATQRRAKLPERMPEDFRLKYKEASGGAGLFEREVTLTHDGRLLDTTLGRGTSRGSASAADVRAVYELVASGDVAKWLVPGRDLDEMPGGGDCGDARTGKSLEVHVAGKSYSARYVQAATSRYLSGDKELHDELDPTIAAISRKLFGAPPGIDEECARTEEQLLQKGGHNQNYCGTARDCLVLPAGICLVGCYLLVNKSADPENYFHLLRRYRSGCSNCRVDCPTLPVADRVACRHSRCVLE